MSWFSCWKHCDVAIDINLKKFFFMDEMSAIFFVEDTKWYVPFHKKIYFKSGRLKQKYSPN